MGHRIAVVGATTDVGREILNTLAERELPTDAVYAVDSSRTVGREVSYGYEDELSVTDQAHFDFSSVDLVFMAADSRTSKEITPKAADAGAVVIDITDAFAIEPGVPLVVPEVNEYKLAEYERRNIVVSPAPVTVPLVMALAPLNAIQEVNRVVVSVYHSVSDGGRLAMDELFNQTRGIYVNEPVKKEQFTKQVAFNVIPHVGDFMDDGATRDEWRLAAETRKIIDPGIQLIATAVQVPVFVGHGLAVHVEFDGPLSVDEARTALKDFPGVSLVDYRQDEGYVTPVECAGEDNVFVSRVREDASTDNGLAFWVVTDSQRKGAALNAVQIAEKLIAEYLDR
jgi:aspartate-semialdehyde dehydrogenase